MTTLYALEHRPERPHDDVDAGTVLHPNGTAIASYDPQFLGAATREVLRLHAAAQAATLHERTTDVP